MATSDNLTEAAQKFVASKIEYNRDALRDLFKYHSTKQIAERLGVVKRTVDLWKQTYKDPSFKNPRKPGAARHRKIVSMLKDNPKVLAARAGELKQVKVSIKAKITIGDDTRDRKISHTLKGDKAEQFLKNAVDPDEEGDAWSLYFGDFSGYYTELDDLEYVTIE